jgi:Flp pilus assembly pilin Flp
VLYRTLHRLNLALVRSGDEEGQALVEYALLISLIAIASVAVVQVLGLRLSGLYSSVVHVFP